MEKLGKISFIIPFYDIRANELLNCVNSIVNENFDDYEIVIVNDGYDNSEIIELCRKICINKNIKYIYQKNLGSAEARNNGIDSSNGEFIMFVDADDSLVSGFKDKLYNSIKEYNEIDFVIFDYSYWTKQGEDIQTLRHKRDFISDKNYVLSNILFNPDSSFMFGSIWAKIFSRKYLDKHHIRFKTELRKAQDRRFMLDVIYNSQNIFYLPIYSYKYKINNNSICHKMNYNMIDYYGRLYKSIIEFKNETQLEEKVFKLVEYYIINEVLPLSIFHLENKKSYFLKRKEFINLYKSYSLDNKIKQISYSEMPSIQSKLKLCLYKNKYVFLLYLLFVIKQKHERRKFL